MWRSRSREPGEWELRGSRDRIPGQGGKKKKKQPIKLEPKFKVHSGKKGCDAEVPCLGREWWKTHLSNPTNSEGTLNTQCSLQTQENVTNMSLFHYLIHSQIPPMMTDRGDSNWKFFQINSHSISDGVSHVAGRPDLLYFMSEINFEL